MKILIYTMTDPQPVFAALERTGRFNPVVADSPESFNAEIGTAEALIIGNSRYPSIAETIVNRAPRLRWIQFSSAGYDALRREDLRPDMVITRAVGVWTPTVVEHALALTLALLRRLPEYRAHQEKAEWDKSIGDRLRSLSGMPVLVVGYGDVGKNFARLAKALGAEITAVATTARTEDGVVIHSGRELPELLPQTELVVLAAPGSNDGCAILGRAQFALMKPSALLVNVGRGSLIDEDALHDALVTGRLAGAAIDVTRTEPLPGNSPLWTTPNLILTPHIGGHGDPTGLARLAALCVTNAVNLTEKQALVGMI